MNSLYISEIFKNYEKLQDENKRRQLERQREIYKKFPRIEAIDYEISMVGIAITNAILKGADADKTISDAKQKMMDLKIEKSEILASKGFPVDYLEMRYLCQKCKDTGYVGNNKCSCFKQKLIDKYYQQSNLKNILKIENFDTFDLGYYSKAIDTNENISPYENMQNVFKAAIDFVKNFDISNESLFFYGSPGLGKTFLTNCIAKDLLDSGRLVIYQTSSNLIELLRKLKFDDENSKDNDNTLLSDILECDLLIIDDLGTEPGTQFSQSELFNIINSRFLKGKKLVISTNYTIEDIIHTYHERITSRIFGSFKLCKFIGEDIRLIKNSPKTSNNRNSR